MRSRPCDCRRKQELAGGRDNKLLTWSLDVRKEKVIATGRIAGLSSASPRADPTSVSSRAAHRFGLAAPAPSQGLQGKEGRRLAMHPPTGGIVSLAELPDAIRLVAENAKLAKS